MENENWQKEFGDKFPVNSLGGAATKQLLRNFIKSVVDNARKGAEEVESADFVDLMEKGRAEGRREVIEEIEKNWPPVIETNIRSLLNKLK